MFEHAYSRKRRSPVLTLSSERRSQRGALLMELLALLVPAAVLVLGAIGFFSAQNRTQMQQDMAVAMEENLRAALSIVSDELRAAGCGAPQWSLGQWIPWAGGFVDHAVAVEQGAFGDAISVARCTSQSIATVTAFAPSGATSLSVASNHPGWAVADLFNASEKSLILIGDRQNARVMRVVGGSIVIDTDPTRSWNQGLPRAYLVGTQISRIDVSSFRVATASSGGTVLELERHGEPEPRPIAEGVSDLRLLPIDPPRRYRVVLSARSDVADPLTGRFLSRTLATDVYVRN